MGDSGRLRDLPSEVVMMHTVSTEPAPAPSAASSPLDRPWVRPAFAVNAVVAWTGVALQAWITVANVYPATGGKPGEIDYHNADGLLGTLGHLFDLVTFFTTWSNVLVAVVVTALALDPHRDSPLWRVLRLSSLLMIVITAAVYAVILGPGAVNVGWQVPTNALLHQVTPALTVLVWLLVGPRGWIRWATVAWSLVIPLVWVAWVLVRGAVIDAYPYGFISVHSLGYATALRNIAGVLVVALVVATVLYGTDALLGRLGHGHHGGAEA